MCSQPHYRLGQAKLGQVRLGQVKNKNNFYALVLPPSDVLSGLLGVIPTPSPTPSLFEVPTFGKFTVQIYITFALWLRKYVPRGERVQPKPYLLPVYARLCQPSLPGFLGLPLLREPCQSRRFHVNLCQAPSCTHLFDVPCSAFNVQIPSGPHPALQSSCGQAPVKGSSGYGQAQSSSLAGKKDCLFIAVSVASVSSC